MKNLLAKALFSAAYVIYCGAFNPDFRKRISVELMQLLKDHGLYFGDKDINVNDVLSD